MHQMHIRRVAIVGASGYSGVELTRLLARHEGVSLTHVFSDTWQGQTTNETLGIEGAVAGLRYQSLSEAMEASGCDFVFLATPVSASLDLVPKLLAGPARVVDLSGAFRFKNASDFKRGYQIDHPHVGLLEHAVYGLTELCRSALRSAQLIANPGCYPTAATLLLAPLFASQLLTLDGVIVNAASGTSGAGRTGDSALSFSEVTGDFRAYKVLQHQHTPEVEQTLAQCAGSPVPVTFTAHLLPVARGILATAYARVRTGVNEKQLFDALQEAYAGSPFVKVLPSPNAVGLKRVVGTNQCHVSVALQTQGLDASRLVAVASIDNLLKGAAGQAVQNFNVANGWPESLALTGGETKGSLT
jgi:N-acetyl-gamma-glutamyl-phosphate reductase